MRYIYSIIKADYLQRTRSYAFLITLAVTIYAAYSFVPPPTANYTTLNVPGYRAVFNSAWVGHLSAIMTSVMLSLYGFFLVNTGIKKDIDTEVGLIIATTPITNFGYLLSKLISNFLVLLTIAGCTFLVSIGMFFLRSTGYPFHIADFVLPYLLFVVPALFFISALAIVAEVFLGKYSIVQYVLFIFLFGVITGGISSNKGNTPVVFIDPYGVSTMTTSIKNTINTQFHENIKEVSFGFIFGEKHKVNKTFLWEGVTWTNIYLFSRVLWICLGIGLVYLSSFFFHRFDFERPMSKKKKIKSHEHQHETLTIAPAGISRALLPPVVADYGIFPFIKTELLLLVRKGSKWFWLINAGVFVSMIFVPLDIAHAYILPVLWFLQVTRWSELATKEKTNRLHYFTYSSYKPLQRMLPAQILAGVILAVALALPIIVRYLIALDIYSVINIFGGAIFIVLLAVCLGIISGGKKLFEIIFFILTYAAIEKIPVTDYLGGVSHGSHSGYMATILMLIVFLGLISFSVRNYQSRHL
ncbi:MAG TPA: hypothetical protein VK668_06610 [Mucilaginibacter sp.]|nr:hypothetical protein [Mucilaginibacter sp.]